MRANPLIIIFCLASLLTINSFQACLSSNSTYKLSTTYCISKKNKNLRLRVTEIPQEFNWINKDLDGKTQLPKKGSVIVFETIENTRIYDSDNLPAYLPAGTKFWAYLNSATNAKSFHRQGKIKLVFFQVQMPKELGGSQIDLDVISYDSQDHSSIVKKSLSSVSTIGAYSLGGALIAPLITLSITGSNLLSFGAVSNPYFLAGSSAVGGAAGLIYGITKKGSQYTLEPGTEIKLDLKEPWKLSEISVKEINPGTSEPKRSEDFQIKINKITKTKDQFEDKALKISLDYTNNSNEQLFYDNFVLVDSMGKEFYPSNNRSADYGIDGLPLQGSLELVYASDFIKAIHKLEVRKTFNQAIIAEQKIIIK